MWSSLCLQIILMSNTDGLKVFFFILTQVCLVRYTTNIENWTKMILKLKAETEKVDLVQETCVTWKMLKCPWKKEWRKEGRGEWRKKKDGRSCNQILIDWVGLSWRGNIWFLVMQSVLTYIQPSYSVNKYTLFTCIQWFVRWLVIFFKLSTSYGSDEVLKTPSEKI